MKTPIFTLDNKKDGDIELSDPIYDVEVRADILTRVVNYQLAKRRAGTQGQRPFRNRPHDQRNLSAKKAQAAHVTALGGSISSVVVASFMALRRAIMAIACQRKCAPWALKQRFLPKLKKGSLTVISSTELKSPKTKDLQAKMAAFGQGSVLVIDGAEVNQNFRFAAGNIIGLDVLPTAGANVYDILRHDKVFLTKDAVAAIEERLS